MTDLERRFRRIVLLVALFGIAAAIAGMFPGEQIFDDANNCFGRAWGGIFTENHHTVDCTESYTKLVATHAAGGLPLVMFVGAELAYGVMVIQRPSRWVGVGWTVWTAIGLAVWFGATFKLDLFTHSVALPAETITYTLLGAMLILICPIAVVVGLTSKRTASIAPDARVVVR